MVTCIIINGAEIYLLGKEKTSMIIIIIICVSKYNWIKLFAKKKTCLNHSTSERKKGLVIYSNSSYVKILLCTYTVMIGQQKKKEAP